MASNATPTYWQCPACKTGLAIVNYAKWDSPQSPTALYCPQCGEALDHQAARHDMNLDRSYLHTPHVRRRAYKCPNCDGHFHSSEWLDVHTDRLVFYLAQMARFFSHAQVASNLGTEGTDGQEKIRGTVTMRVHGQGKVREHTGPRAKLLQVILSGGKAVQLQDQTLAAELRKLAKKYDLPLRILTEDGKYFAIPEGAWHQGQVYGDENDERFARITFTLARAPGQR